MVIAWLSRVLSRYTWTTRTVGRGRRRLTERKWVPWPNLDRLLTARLRFEPLEDRVTPTTIIWSNAAGGSWTVGANWVGGVVPTSADDDVIPDLPGTPTITVSATTAVQTIAAAERIAVSGGTFTVGTAAADATALSGGLSVSGGTLTGGGSLTVSGTTAFSGGTVTSTGKLVLAGPTTLSSTTTINGNVTNSDTFQVTGGQMLLNSPGVFTNNVGATFYLSPTAANPGVTGFGQFDNKGLVNSDGATQSLSVNNYSNAGEIRAAAGTFSLPASGTHSGAFTADVGATLHIQNGTMTVAGATFGGGAGTVQIDAGTYNVTADSTASGASFVSGSATVNVSSGKTFTLSGTNTLTGVNFNSLGTVRNTGTLTVAAAGFGAINFGSNFANAGTLTVTGNQGLSTGSSTTLLNEANSVIDLQADQSIFGSGVISNLGAFTRTVGTGTATIGVPFSGGGAVNVQTGTLSFQAGGTSPGFKSILTGPITTAGGATTQFTNAATFTFASGASFAGAGTAEFANGTFNVTADVSATNLALSTGFTNLTVDPGYTFTLTGANSTWSAGGTIGGTGTVRNTGTLTVSGATTHTLSTALKNAGTTTVSGTPVLALGTTGTLTNEAAGILAITGIATITGSAGGDQVVNAGTLTASASGTVPVGVRVSNTGTVQATAGTLQISKALAQQSGSTLTGGTWRAAGGTLDVFNTTITTVAAGAAIELSGASSAITHSNAIDTVAGTVRSLAGANFTDLNANPVIVTGTLEVGTGAIFWAANNTQGVQVSGATGRLLLTGGTLQAGTSSSYVGASGGGTLAGTGTIQAANVIVSDGVLSPGQSPGILTITGNLSMNSATVTNIEVQGTNPSTPDFDRILVSGSVAFGGTLSVTLLNGFYPDKSESFKFMTFASRTSDFSTFILPNRNAMFLLSASPSATDYTLYGTAYVVRNSLDAGSFSLRNQITNANAGGGGQILFNIPGAGVHTVQPAYVGGGVALPVITSPLFIDGWSQGGDTYTGPPLIEIDGTNAHDASLGSFGLNIQASNTTVRGLAINRFPNVNGNGFGIGVFGAVSGVWIFGNYIGTTADGLSAAGNGQGGIWVGAAATGVTIGAVSSPATERNVISGNTGDGILMQGSGNFVDGNYIGVDATGLKALGNTGSGVFVDAGAANNRIGLGDPSNFNVISGNRYGVRIEGAGAKNNRVQGNRIGTDATGLAALPNVTGGVRVANTDFGNWIGTDSDAFGDAFEGNLISGNSGDGVGLDAATATIIAGNSIGLKLGGAAALPNTVSGVRVGNGSTGTLVGGSTTVTRNVISGNQGYGVVLTDGTTTGTTVSGNYIGTNALGTAAVGNALPGVEIDNQAHGNTIGGTAANAGNLISGNSVGVQIADAGTTGNLIQGNLIGTNAAGTGAIGNFTGVHVFAGANANTIGGSVAAARNVISGNTQDGVDLDGSGTTGNTVAGNFIGVDQGGNTKLPNGLYGVYLGGSATGNTIGGLTGTAGNPAPGTAPGNVISGNAGYQLAVYGSGNTIQGNIVGLAADGSRAVDPAGAGVNAGDGINNTLYGGTDVRARNVFGGLAVDFYLGNGAGTQLLNNYIGVDKGGTLNRGGISYLYGTTNLTIGAAGAGNVWVGSSTYTIFGFGSNWTLQGNRFGTTADGTTPLVNTNGVYNSQADNTTIGGTGAGEGNQFGDFLDLRYGSGGTTQGNTFGLNAAGTAVLAGSVAGLGLYRQAGVTVGDGTAAGRNVFASGNAYGLVAEGFGTDGTVIRGNYFGTNATGTATLGSFQYSIYVGQSATNTTVDGNVIATGSYAGVRVDGGSSSAVNDIPNYAVAWFKAAGNFTNSTGYQQPGTAVGTVAFGTGVAGGQAFQISRATQGYVKSEHTTYTLRANSLSVEGWINPATLPASQDYLIAANGDIDSPNYAASLFRDVGGMLRLQLRYLTTGGQRSVVSDPLSWAAGSFHHVAVTGDATTVRFYVDGVLFSSTPLVGTPTTNYNPVAGDPSITLYVGGATGTTNHIFDGKIDELAVYDRALTAAEIARIFGIGGADKGGSWTRNTTITGNIIGLLADGMTAGALTGDGIRIDNSESNTVGGTTAAARNVIGKAGGSGVHLTATYARFNTISGNYIGTDKTGNSRASNDTGVQIDGGANTNTVGGGAAGARNVISGNLSFGVRIQGTGTSGNRVQGNYLNPNASGVGRLFTQNGVRIDTGASGNVIGTDGDGTNDATEGNVITGDNNPARIGVLVQDSGSNNNVIAGNTIGLDAGGAVNAFNVGVFVNGGPTGTRIGTDADGTSDDKERNVIAGNVAYGVELVGANNNRVAGNYIGLNAAGTAAAANQDAVAIFSATGNVIGTDGTHGAFNANERNYISGNTDRGVILSGANVVAGNWIGLKPDGTSAGNQQFGIQVTETGARVGTNADGVGDADERNVISGNSIDGIIVRNTNTSGTVIAGNYIGTDPTGTFARPNGTGIEVILGATNNTIGGTAAAARNVISGNSLSGVSVTDAGTTGNTVAGNYIGTNVTGTAALANVDGVYIAEASGNTIGGTAPGSRNVISGNTATGVDFGGYTTTANVVAGNYIGTNAAGLAALPNVYGVQFGGTAFGNTVGGTTAAGRNVISGNKNYGVVLLSGGPVGNLVQGNWIGLAADGDTPLGQGVAGIVIPGSFGNTIGGTAAGAGNVISGNANFGGIWFAGGANNVVQGNLIGTTPSGTAARGNTIGILINGGATNNTIGGLAAGAGNVISGNTSDGVQVTGIGTAGNKVQGNYIGTKVDGLSALGNGSSGVYVYGGASANVIGGSAAGAGNVLSGNGANGVAVADAGTNSTIIQGNFIGTDKTGTAAVPNLFPGVAVVNGATNTQVGGLTATPGTGAGNVISGNKQHGVMVRGAGANGTVIQGNLVGLAAGGTAKLANGANGSYGGVVVFNGAANTTIGGANPLARNVVSGNENVGIAVLGAAGLIVTGTVIQGNYVGTDITGSVAIGNGQPGIGVLDLVANTTIGGAAAGAGNIVSGNAGGGVVVSNYFGTGAPTGTIIQGNRIGTNLAGTAALSNTIFSTRLDGSGVILEKVAGTTVGGTAAGAGNVISGNTGNGVTITGNGTTGNKLLGNYVGLGADGDTKIANVGGVFISSGASGNVIGGSAAGSRNVISGNTSHGIQLNAPGGTGNKVQGNYIGTDKTGLLARGNTGVGVNVVNGDTGNVIGTDGDNLNDATEGNVISGNNQEGVVLNGAHPVGNVVAGNIIGLGKDGLTPVGNLTGIRILNSDHNRIGTNADGVSDALERNVIGSNTGAGVQISSAGSASNVVAGNYIGTDAGGTLARPNNNGVLISAGATNNTVGGAAAGAGNLVSGNTTGGVRIDGATTIGNTVARNLLYANGANVNLVLANGANNNTPAATITGVLAGPLDTQIIGQIALAAPNSTYKVEVFYTPNNAPETRQFLAEVQVTTGGTGTAVIDLPLGVGITQAGYVTVTLTRLSTGDTGPISAATLAGLIIIDGQPATSVEGTPITLTTRAIDPGPGQRVGYAWRVTKNGADFATGNEAVFTYTPDDNAVYVVSLTVTTTTGLRQAVTLSPLNVTNAPPVIELVSPPSGDVPVGGSAVLTARITDPGTADLARIQYTWSVNGQPVSGPNPLSTTPPSYTLQPTAAGLYTVTLAADDLQGGTRSLSYTIKATGSLATPLIAVQATAQEGTTVHARANLPAILNEDDLTFYWMATKNGVLFASATGKAKPNFEFTPDDNGSYVVTLTVTGPGTNVTAPPQTVTVTNIAPQPSIGYAGTPPTAFPINTAIHYRGSVTDPGTADLPTEAYQWQVSNVVTGATVQTAAGPAFDYTPTAAGTFLVRLTAADKDGGAGNTATALEVTPQGVPALPGPPTVTSLTPTAGPYTEGAAVTFTATAADPDRPADPINYRWLVGGVVQPNQTSPVFTFVPPKGGTFAVTVQVKDTVSAFGGAPQSEMTVNLTAANQPPTVAITPAADAAGDLPPAVPPGFTYNLTAQTTDPGTGSLSYTWSVLTYPGGNALPPGSFATSPTDPRYFSFNTAQSGTYVASVKVTDDNGDSATKAVSFVFGSAGNDTITVTAADLAGGADRVVVFALGGNDVVDARGVSFPVVLDGGAGNDTLYGGGGDDLIEGGAGDDQLYGGGGNDTLVAQHGNDHLHGGKGHVTFVVVPGSDAVLDQSADGAGTIDLSAATAGVTLDLNKNDGVARPVNTTATVNTLAFSGPFEAVKGSQYGDQLTAASNTTVFGGGGSDDLTAPLGATNVTVFGGDGGDMIHLAGATGVTVFGGDGADTIEQTAGSNITVFGGAGDDDIRVLGGSNVTVFGGAGDLLPGTTDLGLITQFGAAGNDTITVGDATHAPTQVTVFGGDGNDQVNVVAGSNVTVFGEAGNDIIYVGANAGSGVTVFGGGGDDVVSVAGGTMVTVFGGDGNDAVTVTGGTQVTVFGGGGDDALTVNASTVTVFGGDGNDAINVMAGSGVTVFGDAGDDHVTVGAGAGGNVTVFGGDGADNVQVLGGTNVTVFGDAGNDTIGVAGGTNVTVFGGADDDALSVSGGTGVTVFGGDGKDDVQVLGGSQVTVFGDAGNDTLTVGANAGSQITVFGGADDDTIHVQGGTQVTVFGGDGNDAIDVTGGSQVTVFGGANDDHVTVGAGTDITVFGGAGNDDVSVSGGTNVTVFGNDGNDALTVTGGTNVTVFGGADNDSITVNAPNTSNVTAFGGDGDDTVSVLAGSNVTVFGGAGNDQITVGAGAGTDITVFGGDGNDAIDVQGGTRVTVFGGADDDHVTVGPGVGSDITVFGGDGNDAVDVQGGTRVTVFGEAGNDSITSEAATGGNITVFGGTGDDTVNVTAGSNVTVFGESGNDTLTVGPNAGSHITVFGGSGNDKLSGTGGTNVILLGDRGNDTLSVTGVSNVTAFGGDGDDTLTATGGVDIELYGDDGNDLYRAVASAVAATRVRFKEILNLGKDNDPAQKTTDGDLGGLAQNDRPAAGTDAIDLSAFYAVVFDLNLLGNDASPTVGLQTVKDQALHSADIILQGVFENVIGTPGDDHLIGNAANNWLVGNAGDDTLDGNAGDDTLEGGAGNDTLNGGTGNDTYRFAGLSLNPGQLPGGDEVPITVPVGGYALGTDIITGEAPDSATDTADTLDFSALAGPVTVDLGSTAVQTVPGVLAFQLPNATAIENAIGSAGADSITGNSRDNVLEGGPGDDTLKGLAGSDTYVFAGDNLGTDTLDEAYVPNHDTLDFGQLKGGINLDLNNGGVQWFAAANTGVILLDPRAFDNVIGTSFPDTIIGNAADNVLIGGGGRDYLDGRGGADTLRGGSGQVIYLDFATAAGRPGVWNYDAGQQQTILAGVQADFAPFGYVVTLTRPASGPYITIVENDGQAGGSAETLDFRNTRLDGTGSVFAYGLKDQLARDLAAAGRPVPTDVAGWTPYIDQLTTTITAHEVGHMVGLRHGDAYGLIGSGVNSVAQAAKYLPALPSTFTGAAETAQHIMASPASVGSTLVDAASTTAPTYVGGREAVKLAFNDTGTTLREPLTGYNQHGSTATAVDLGVLPGLYVPNTFPVGHSLYGQSFSVRAEAVVGGIVRGTNPTSENDFYSFAAAAGDTFHFEVNSYDLARIKNPIDSVLRLFDANGNPVPLYGANTQTYQDDEFETPDAVIVDWAAPAGGKYYLEVDTYAPDAIRDTDTGDYELFLYSWKVGPNLGLGDLIVTDRAGETEAETGPRFVVSGPAAADQGQPVTLSVSINGPAPATAPTYAWTVVGPNLNQTATGSQVTFTGFQPGTYTATLTVTDADGGTVVATDPVTVNNVAPTPAITGVTGVRNEGQALTAAGTLRDPGGATDTLTYQWRVYTVVGATETPFVSSVAATVAGTTTATAVPPFTFTPPDDGTYRVKLSVRDQYMPAATPDVVASTDVVVANVAPTLTLAGNGTVGEGSAYSLILSGYTDPGTDTPTAVVVAWGDGTPDTPLTATQVTNLRGGQSVTLSHTYADGSAAGTARTITAAVTDEDGTFTGGTKMVTVNNVPPTATLGNNGPVNEANPATATVSFTGPHDDSSADTAAGFHYSFAATSGGLAGTYALAGTATSQAFTYTDSGTYTVYGRVFDKDDGFTQYTTTVTVTNVAPSGTLTNSGPVTEPGTATATFTNVTDPSPVDTAAGFKYAFALSGGTLPTTYAAAAASPTSAGFYFPGSGVYTIVGRVFDKDNGYRDYTTAVTVNNVPPTVTAAGPTAAAEGTAVTFTGSFTDPGGAADLNYQYRWHVTAANGQAIPDQTGTLTAYTAGGTAVPAFAFTPNDNGTYTVTLTVTDKGNGATTFTTPALAVSNVAPTATGISGPTSVPLNATGTYALTGVSDPSSVDTASLHYSFALTSGGLAGTYAAAPATNSFTTAPFTTPGAYTVYARVYDKDGDVSGTQQLTVNVAGQPGTATLINGDLYVYGTTAADTIFVNLSGTQIRVQLNGTTLGTYPVTGKVWVYANDGNDAVTVDSAVTLPTALYGENGNDTLRGGSGPDRLDGGAGDDSLAGNAGDDSVFGGIGNDKLDGGIGNDYLDAGDGDNTVYGGAGNDTILAGAGKDSVTGDDGDDYISVGDGRNTVYAGLGNDTVITGSGDDKITGDDGNDSISAGDGTNTVYGGAGNDTITTGTGNDYITGDDGSDSITAGAGNNTVYGGAGNDTITAGAGNDSITGDDGDDSITAGDGTNTVYGGTGNDTITAGTGNDSITGDDGNDSISAGDGTNTVYGGAGDDTITAGAGNDSIGAGEGNNLVNAGDGNNTVSAGAGNDTITTGAGNDSVTAGDGANSVTGGDGNDTLIGGIGNDTLNGGAGNDSLVGNAGDDRLDGGTGYADSLYGGDGNDTLTDPDGVAYASGGNGADTLTLTFAAGWNLSGSVALPAGAITGGAGNDSITVTTNIAGMTFDVNGDDGDDTIELHGVWQKVTIYGGAGTNDTARIPMAVPASAFVLNGVEVLVRIP